ncbi:MAG: recombination mediator RecR [Bacteroidia bacterium]
MHYPSRLMEQVVEELSKLPTIGKRTAMRLSLHLLKQQPEQAIALSHAIEQFRTGTQYCEQCHNISDTAVCNICANAMRDHSLLCVVEDVRDVMAIENTAQYKGVYHVLNGLVSPMDGIGPDDLTINSLLQKVQNNQVAEVVLALNTTVEGETTCFYVFKRLQHFNVKVTTIARGIAHNDALEYTDELTLGKSIANRINYEYVR